jgi:4-hydroxy-3-methylbut-2-enyl diphosphate reductase
VQALAWLVLLDEPSVHCFHHIVHNEAVVERFERLGVRFVDDPADVPLGATVLLSAHGTPPAVQATIARRAGWVVDAVCPLVSKVHREIAARAAAGDRILYVGRTGHDETDGALAIAPGHTTIVGGADEVTAIPHPGGPVAVLAQTTLRVEEVEDAERAARRRFGSVWTPPRSDICDASSTRQAVVRQVAPECDTVVVVGSATSSNTESLVAAAVAAGAGQAVRVAGADELPADLSGTVAVTAGASTPDHLVDAVVHRLGGQQRAEIVHGPAERHQHFPVPGAVRRLVVERTAPGALDDELAALAADPRTSAEDLLCAAEARLGVAPPAPALIGGAR